MKVTYRWLQEFVDIRIPAEELAEKLTMAGLEVKSIETRSQDHVFEIEITSNRADWLSVLGVAREVAALTGKQIKKPPAASRQPPAEKGQRWPIEIEDPGDCPLYTARIIRGVKVGPSPAWLRERLESVGVRSVNNIVDITNYVLYELGEPLHAFDLDTLGSSGIGIRRARSTEKLISIDGTLRSLDPSVLAITDMHKPVAIAGIMGAKDTEVTGQTTNVLLEAALFDPVVVRRSRQKLGMQSEAAYRFERGIDPQIVERASGRAAELIVAFAGGTCSQLYCAGRAARKRVTVAVAVESIERHLGIAMPLAAAARIISSLGFESVRKTRHRIVAGVPSWRPDVKIEMDLIEEIARIHGYDRIPSTLPSVLLTATRGADSSIPKVKDILVGLGLSEVITHSLIDRQGLSGYWQDDARLIEVANPLSREQELMRPLLMPSLARAVAQNVRQQQPFVGIFEIARTYRREKAGVRQPYALGIALYGTRSQWFGPGAGHVQDEASILHLKGALDAVFERTGITPLSRVSYQAAEDRIAVFIDGVEAGYLRQLPRQLLEPLDIKHKPVFAAEIFLEEVVMPRQRPSSSFDAARVPRYPGMVRDLTLEVKDEIALAAIMSAVASMSEPLLAGADFAAYYTGGKVPAGFKRITISCQYRSCDRTLTDAEVGPAHDRVVAFLMEKLHARIC